MKLRLGVIILVLMLFISACSSDRIDKITIYKMESFSKVNEGSIIEITDSKVIKNIKQAFNSAHKEPGIVNMADPQFKVEIGTQDFFLFNYGYNSI